MYSTSLVVMLDETRRNWPQPPRVEAWEWRSARDLPIGPEVTGQSLKSRTFTLEDHWRRGGFEASLFAETEAESVRYRADLLRQWWDWVSDPIDPRSGFGRADFVRVLARNNGHPLATLRKKLPLSDTRFAELRGELLDREIIFELPFFPTVPRLEGDRASVPTAAPLFYFRDTGMLHSVLALAWPPDDKRHKYYDRSWEGFAVQVLFHTVGRGASAHVWRHAQDEIDLVLEWPDGRIWAVEIGRSENKRVSAGFHRGVAMLGAERSWVLHKGACDIQNRVRRTTLEQVLAELER